MRVPVNSRQDNIVHNRQAFERRIMADKEKKRRQDWEEKSTEEQKKKDEHKEGEERVSGRNYEFVKGVLFGVLLSGVCVMTIFLVLHGTVGKGGTSQAESGASALTSRETLSKLGQIQERIEDAFLYEVDGDEITDWMMKGVAAGLDDPYANYYTAEELQTIEESSQGEYYGIGITLLKDAQDGQIKVAGVYQGSPADEAGMMEDDRLIRVGDVDVSDMDLSSVVALIKGQEEQKELTVIRGAKELTLTVQGAAVEIPTVSFQMLEDGIGCLKISEFAGVTVEQFKDAMAELEERGMEKLVVDVRGNPGGNLDSVCDILDELLPEGLMVYTEDKYGNREEYTSDEEHRFDKPLAVLVNGNSASAAEIFAGAIQDYGLGTVVGTTTYGKGVVQRTYLLDDGSALKLTTETYFTSSGRQIDGAGIEPDVVVEEAASGTAEDEGEASGTAEDHGEEIGTAGDKDAGQSESEFNVETDAQLRAAVELLRDM